MCWAYRPIAEGEWWRVFRGTGVLMMTSIGIVSNTMRRNNKTSLMWFCLESSLSYLGVREGDKGRREIEKIVGTCAVSFLVRSINKSVATKARSYPTLLAIAIAARERGGGDLYLGAQPVRVCCRVGKAAKEDLLLLLHVSLSHIRVLLPASGL